MFTREEKRRQRQEEVLLLLDMRLACLLVDRGGSDRLRQHLFLLRGKLENESLDGETLTAVETTVRALTQKSKNSRLAKARIGAMTAANANHIAQAAQTMTSRDIAMNRLRSLDWRNAPRPSSSPRPNHSPKIPVLARTGGVASLTGFFGLVLWLRQLSE